MGIGLSKAVLFLTFLWGSLFTTFASTNLPPVYVFEINDEISAPVWHNFQLALKEANELQASQIIINMNTYGGEVVMADSIRTAILKSEIPVIMLINNNAASAGALISIACSKIFMTPGSTIGAATVVTQDGAKAIDKYQSYFRSKMRATAEVTGRDPKIAEAMVDQDIEIKGITTSGKLLTFTVTEAITNGYCEQEVKNLNELLIALSLANNPIQHYTPTSVNNLISWLITPAISGVLIMLMMGGIYFELQSPGIGFPLAAALVAATLFFAPLYLEGLAENWEILLFLIGIILIALEVFVIPGTGITGILGVSIVISSLTLAMVENVSLDFSAVEFRGILVSLSVVMSSFLIMIILIITLLPNILSFKAFSDLVQTNSQEVEDGFIGIDSNIKKLVGQTGLTVTDLRPSGTIQVNSEHFDAYSQGSFIEKGSSIEIISTDGPQLIVRKNKL